MSDEEQKPRKTGLITSLRNNFFTGLVVVLPIALTIWLVWTFIGFVDNRVLPLVPDAYNPFLFTSERYGIDVRGFGVVIFLIFTTIIGALAKGIFGRSLIRMGERFVDRVPVIRTIYNGAKQIVETFTSGSSQSFQKAALIEYPRKGIWAVGFITGTTGGEVLKKSGQKEMWSMFVPTTPNPTSGFLLFFPKKDTVVLDMELEDAIKLIISAGAVEPPTAAEIKAGKASRDANGKK